MAVNKLSECQTVDQFNDFIKGKINIKVGATIGRKFMIGGTNYTLNQIWQQFEKCIVYDNEHETAEPFKIRNTKDKILELDRRANREMSQAIEKKELSSFNAIVIKIWQAIGNFFARLGGVYRKQIEERVTNLIRDIEGKTQDATKIKAQEIAKQIVAKKLLLGIAWQICRLCRKQAEAIIAQLLAQNFDKDALAKLDIKEPDVLDIDHPAVKKFSDNLRFLRGDAIDAKCYLLDFDHEGSMSVAEFVRLMSREENARFKIELIEEAKHEYTDDLWQGYVSELLPASN